MPTPRDSCLTAFLSRVRERLLPLPALLGRAVAPREAEFLELGDQLRQVAGEVDEAIEQAEFLAGLTSQEGLRGFGDALGQEMDRVHQLHELSGGARNQAELNAIRGNLQSLIQHLERFKRIVKHLHMLGISTRIESARLGAEGRGFGSLADDVEKLAVKIGRQSDAIQRKAAALDVLAQDALRQTAAMLAAQEACADSMAAGVTVHLQALMDLAAASQALSQELAEGARAVRDDIHRAVGSLQFHDITRQQVEHVQQAVEELLDMIDEHRAIQGESLPETDAELVDCVADLTLLQSRQVDNASRQFGEAVDLFKDTVADIAAQLERLDGAAQSGETAGDDGGALVRMEAAISQGMEAMARFGTEGEAMGGVMIQAAAAIHDMLGFLEEVEEVGASIELIALNASVKAAHTGDKGKAMGVLAQSIQALSREAGELTEAIAASLAQVGAAADALRANAESFRQQVRVEEAMARLESLMRGLVNVDAERESLRQEIASRSRAVAAEARRLAEGVVMHRHVAAALGKCKDLLDDIHAEAQPLASPGHEARRPARLEKLMSRYTMESERAVHHAAAGRHAGRPSREAPAGDVELFDNVELF